MSVTRSDTFDRSSWMRSAPFCFQYYRPLRMLLLHCLSTILPRTALAYHNSTPVVFRVTATCMPTVDSGFGIDLATAPEVSCALSLCMQDDREKERGIMQQIAILQM